MVRRDTRVIEIGEIGERDHKNKGEWGGECERLTASFKEGKRDGAMRIANSRREKTFQHKNGGETLFEDHMNNLGF